MTKSVGMHEAKTHLSRLVAEAQAGEEVIITVRGVPAVRLVPAAPARVFGIDRGAFEIPDDFDAPLPDEVLDLFDA